MITKILKSKMFTYPIKLTVGLTYLCNSRCKTCNVWKIYKEEPEKAKKELNLEEWKKIFNEFDNLGWIEFTGGEPTLKRGVEKIISYAYNNTGIKTGGFTTNAINPKRSLDITERILCEIPENKVLIVGISMDGLNHDEIRGVDGSFEKSLYLFENLSYLKEYHKNLVFHFAYTISEYNAGKFKLFYDYINKNNGISIKDITVTFEHFNTYYGTDSKNIYRFKNDMIADVNDYIRITKNEKISKNLFMKIKSIFYDYYLKNIPMYIENNEKMIIPCVANRYSAYIDPYGDIYPCSQWNKKLGNLRDNCFDDIWRSDISGHVRDIIDTKTCPNCWTPCEAQSSWLMNFGLLRGWW